jgi:hypothetical protein
LVDRRRISLRTRGVARLRLLLRREFADVDEPLLVTVNGRAETLVAVPVSWPGGDAHATGADPYLRWDAEVVVDIPARGGNVR